MNRGVPRCRLAAVEMHDERARPWPINYKFLVAACLLCRANTLESYMNTWRVSSVKSEICGKPYDLVSAVKFVAVNI